MISYVLPTHDRPAVLAATLDALGRLAVDGHRAAGGAEVIVVDNASTPPAEAPHRLANGIPVLLLRRCCNEGAAARNAGARAARGEWIVMLDDDSHPLDTCHVDVVLGAPPDVAAIGADIVLPGGKREAGGLPEVFVGCGAAVRREAFLASGGYDEAFGYYAEEYDLCARFLLEGWRIVHDGRFRVRHAKAATGRDMDVILARLVRNSGWIAQRYAPAPRREGAVRAVIERYASIALRESAERGYAAGLGELHDTLDGQPLRPMDRPTYDRFTGRAAVQAVLDEHAPALAGRRVGLLERGKNAVIVEEELAARGAAIARGPRGSDLLAIGTLSPGPMWDAWEHRSGRGGPVLPPWVAGAPVAAYCQAAPQRAPRA